MKKNNWGFILLVALMAGTGFFLLRGQTLTSLFDAIKGLKPGWLLLGLGLMFVFVGCEALCSRIILEKLGHRPGYRKCLGYSFIGFYVSSITPSSSGGQPAQIYQMTKDDIPAAHGTLNMMLIAVCFQVVSLAYALGAFFFLRDQRAALGTGLGLLLLYGGAVVTVLTVGMLIVMFLPGVAKKLTGGVLSLLVKVRIVKDAAKAGEKLERQMEEYRAGAECFKKNPMLLPALLAITFVQLTALFAIPYVVYLAFGLHGASVVQVVGMQAIISMAVGSLPLPGAMGAAEGGFVTAFSLFFGAGLVTPAVLVSRGISFYSFLLLSGAITLAIQWRNRRRAGEKKLPLASANMKAALG
ncbi:MAG: flippase-like domain-containing protein [Clostridia bacterium]|nr:flippase-like domain-containing protein [Clostridia bacterium]